MKLGRVTVISIMLKFPKEIYTECSTSTKHGAYYIHSEVMKTKALILIHVNLDKTIFLKMSYNGDF